jgi:hypothetical protein
MAVPSPVDLERRFISWTDEERTGLRLDFMADRGDDVGWDALLEKPRVVVLAEAGAGKSTELRLQTERLRRADRNAFFATVQDVARGGLRAAVAPALERAFDAWRSGEHIAWIFIDSFDEARLDKIQLPTALNRLARDIGGAESRARIVLSGRYTDWDTEGDREAFEAVLPTQSHETPPAPSADVLLGHILRHDKAPEPPVKIAADVMMMAPLDEPRVRQFASALNVLDVDTLMAAIEAANLWRFARRPLDLGWIVEFWQANQRLGSLREMLDTSLAKRSAEWNRRRGDDPLEPVKCGAALERIGAALVFGQLPTVALPGLDVASQVPSDALDLNLALPDWAQDDVARLLDRPAFDPSTLGRSRLHNDNEGDVRAFLAARWLRRLRDANCPLPEIEALLFAEVYEHALIRPAARATAAWLSLRDTDIARGVMVREPMLLMTAGDPASLPTATRAAVLDTWVGVLLADPSQRPIYDHDKLRRFSTPDLVEPIRTLWATHRHHGQTRLLLLMMIWLGRLSACLDIALEAAIGPDSNEMGLIFAGRAVAAMGGADALGALGAHLRATAGSLSALFVWEAVEALFPSVVSIDDLFAFIDQVANDEGYGFSRMGEKLAGKLERPDALAAFIQGVLARARAIDEPPGTYEYMGASGQFGPALAAAAMRLMKRSQDDEAPLPAVDAYLWLNRDRHAPRTVKAAETTLKMELCRTSARRRALFWRAAERLNPSLFGANPLTHHYQLSFFGWPGGLELADLNWLLQDMPVGATADDRQLALSAAHQVWQDNGMDPAVLARIEAAAAQAEPRLAQMLQMWLSPQSESPEMLALKAQNAELTARHESERAKRDASWKEFLDEMRAEVAQIRDLVPRTDNSVDRRLYQLWVLARSVCARNNEYAFDSLAPVEPLFGPDLTRAFEAALVRFWRAWTPILRTDREVGKRNMVSEIDCIGIAAISVEASRSPDWALSLSDQEAALATRFATLELNGFPTWLTPLAAARPAAVGTALAAEVARELEEIGDGPFVSILDRLPRAADAIKAAVAPALLEKLEARTQYFGRSLPQLLGLLVRGLAPTQAGRLAMLALERAANTTDLPIVGDYLSALFALQPNAAMALLTERLDVLSPEDQTSLATSLLPKLFGHDVFRPLEHDYQLPFDVLKRLVLVAFNTIRVEDDLNRPQLKVYSPNARDHAEGARSAIYNRLRDVPGRATYDFLLELARTEGFPISPLHLREEALRRAWLDADLTPWPAGAAFAFEREHEHAPTSALELQQLLARRLAELDHELNHGDFNQDRTLKLFAKETPIQNWVGHELRAAGRNSFGIDRETHRADEKKPDLVARAKASDANVAIEIKVVDELSVAELENALTTQLCGQYLRAGLGRHGVLLLVYQHARRDGWKIRADEPFVPFSTVVEHLKGQAREIAGASGDAPQPVIAVLDVSGLPDGDETTDPPDAIPGQAP